MKAVIAIDSFKGSLSSVAAGNIVAKSLKKLMPDMEVAAFPLADGGEGTVEAMTEGLKGYIVATEVTGPLGDKVQSRYGYLPETGTAVIEMADAAGLPMVPSALRNPLHTTTYGLGELILAALDAGCRDFIIGIGGSATNDAGLGMLTALGARFLQEDGTPAGIKGEDLAKVAKIDLSQLDYRLREVNIRVACDVNNPLCGPQGCSVIYGPQKGATPEIVKAMDGYIAAFAQRAAEQCGLTGADMPGAGAAGGLGYAFHAFLHGQLQPGIELILSSIGIKKQLQEADFLITGEGRMDGQTAMGKAPVGVAQLAKALNPQILTIAVCGCAAPEAEAVNDHGIDGYFPILQQVATLEEAMGIEMATRNLEQTVTQLFRVLLAK